MHVHSRGPISSRSVPILSLPGIGPKVRTLLQLGVSLGLLAYLLVQVDWLRAIPLIGNADGKLLLALFALYAADRVLMALKWRQLLRVLGGKLSRWGAIRVYYESTFIGFALPLGGLGPDLVRFIRLRSRGIDPHITLPSIVMERLMGLVAMLALVVVGLAALAGLAGEPALREFARLCALGALAAGALALVLIFHPASGHAFSRLFRLPALLERARLAKYADSVRAYASRRPVLAVNLGLSMIEQTTPVLAYWAGSHALGTPLPFLVCLSVAPVTVVIQRLPISYAGLGLREGTAAALLVALGYDYSEVMVLFMMLFVVFFISLLPGAVLVASGGAVRHEDGPSYTSERARLMR